MHRLEFYFLGGFCTSKMKKNKSEVWSQEGNCIRNGLLSPLGSQVHQNEWELDSCLQLEYWRTSWSSSLNGHEGCVGKIKVSTSTYLRTQSPVWIPFPSRWLQQPGHLSNPQHAAACISHSIIIADANLWPLNTGQNQEIIAAPICQARFFVSS